MIARNDSIEFAREAISKAKSIAVLTGAGISAESGIPTFRGKDGVWEKFSASELATPDAFERSPLLVWQWYGSRRREMLASKPNPAHFAIAEIERIAEKFLLITQNIDNLHSVAGNRKIAEIHGNIFRNRCLRCGSVEHDEQVDFASEKDLPICGKCGSLARVDVVWFGERLPEKELWMSHSASERCDVFLMVGTSAQVYPAAAFPEIAKINGAILIEVNLEQTHLSRIADFSFIGKAGEIMPRLIAKNG